VLPIIEGRFFVMSLTMVVIIGGTTFGCRCHLFQRPVSNARTLGSVVDEVNRQQEENAELAKFTIYMHEFEINALPVKDDAVDSGNGVLNQGARGYRLTPSGKDHVRQIARQLLQATGEDGQQPTIRVIVERSNTSKLASSTYQYPVHHNPELDAVRRQMVISALQGLGVSWADTCVMVAPAFSTGMSAAESAETYQQAFGGEVSPSGGGGSGGYGNSYDSGGFEYRP
jgi:hypothetical protein